MGLRINSNIRREWRVKLLWEQKTLCHWCREPMQIDSPGASDYATFEHLKRKREGGKCNWKNLVLAHTRCNHERG